jgi:hypothetical protein
VHNANALNRHRFAQFYFGIDAGMTPDILEVLRNFVGGTFMVVTSTVLLGKIGSAVAILST